MSAHQRRIRGRMRASALFGVAAVLFGTAATLAGPTAVASANQDSIGKATKSATVARTHLLRGNDIEVDSRDVTVSVSQTLNLRDRQAISVTWKGAHPTGGVVADTNSSYAAQQEYPMVVLQCRGADSPDAPIKVSPETCWTSDAEERAKSSSAFLFPPYRIDRYASPADRQQVVGVPNPIPPACAPLVSGAQHWVPFIGSNGTVFGGGLLDQATSLPCAGSAPEAGGGTTTSPSNTTYGVTYTDGTGNVNFVINTVDSNASLGCTRDVACTLVVIPIMGISCDAAAASLPAGDRPPTTDDRNAADKLCQKSGYYAPGATTDGSIDVEDLAVSGQLWWSASNWRNRLSFPLSFAQASNVCDLVSTEAPEFVYGSQALVPATQQWGPAFCLNPKLFKFQHVQFSEPGSRNLLTSGSIKAAFTAAPPDEPFERPIVQAPVAVSGFAIGMRLDGADGKEVFKANMTPRLLAKLMTNSYAGLVGVQKSYPELKDNPLDIVADPEFRALNPGMMTTKNAYNAVPASTLYSMSSDSDVMQAITSYIQADPDARKWLNGEADPWGMKVNPKYKGIALPLNSWPQSDPFVLQSVSQVSCFASTPLPWFPLINAPVANPATVTLNMQYGLSNSQIVCKDAGQPNQKLVSLGKIPPGRRALFGLISLADAQRYQIPTASLLSHVDPTAPSKFATTAGRTFVAPGEPGMKAAMALTQPNKTLGTWPIPYKELRESKGKNAYPGTLLMSMAVPSQGLKVEDAKRYATMIRILTTTGQTPGLGNGQLAPGYLPITPANGLGALTTYSVKAAAAIEDQKGFVPAVDGSLPPPSPTPTPTPSATSTPVVAPTPISTPTYGGNSDSGNSSGGQQIPTTGPTGEPAPSQSVAATPTPSPSQSAILAKPVGSTSALQPPGGTNAVPVLIGIALLSGAASLMLAWRRPS
jgi:hypothetical protein